MSEQKTWLGLDDVQALQEIGIDLMLLVRPGQLLFRDDALKAHSPHETGDAFPVDLEALSLEPGRHPGDAPGGVLRVLPVDEPHETEVEVGDRDAAVIEARPGKAQELALPGNGDDLVVHVDEPPFLLE